VTTFVPQKFFSEGSREPAFLPFRMDLPATRAPPWGNERRRYVTSFPRKSAVMFFLLLASPFFFLLASGGGRRTPSAAGPGRVGGDYPQRPRISAAFSETLSLLRSMVPVSSPQARCGKVFFTSSEQTTNDFSPTCVFSLLPNNDLDAESLFSDDQLAQDILFAAFTFLRSSPSLRALPFPCCAIR